MVMEYLRYDVGSDRKKEFEEAYRQAGAHMKSSPHCLGYELACCVKQPSQVRGGNGISFDGTEDEVNNKKLNR